MDEQFNRGKSENKINQLTNEIDYILHDLIDRIGVAYSIVKEVSDKHGKPTTWTINVEGSKFELTVEILLHYLNRHQNLKDALTRYIYDHISYENKS